MKNLDKYNGQDVPKILVANKVDLSTERKVSTEEGRELASKNGMKFFETSAKTGESVAQAFEHLAGLVADIRYKDAPPANAKGVEVDKIHGGKSTSCKC